MKKSQRFVSFGMKKKIFLLVLFSLLFLSVAMLLVVNMRVNYLGEMVARINNEQNTAISGLSSDYVEQAITDLTSRTSALEAYLLNSTFEEVARKVTVLADLVEECFEDTSEVA